MLSGLIKTLLIPLVKAFEFDSGWAGQIILLSHNWLLNYGNLNTNNNKVDDNT